MSDAQQKQYAASMRVQPILRKNVGGLTKHNARTMQDAEKLEHVNAENVEYNRILIGSDDPSRNLADAISGVKMARAGKIEGDEFVGAEIILTAHHDYFEKLDDDSFEAWVDKNVSWLRNEFDAQGRGRVVSAILHLDERSPHIHAIVAPTVETSRINPVTKEPMPSQRRINYTAVFLDRKAVLVEARKMGRSHLDTKLGRLQTSYASAVEEFGLRRGRQSARTEQEDLKHVAPHEYRAAEKLRNEAEILKENVASLEAQILEQKHDLKNVQSRYSNTQKMLEDAESKIASIDKKVADAETKIEDINNEVEQLNLKKEQVIKIGADNIKSARSSLASINTQIEDAKLTLNTTQNENTKIAAIFEKYKNDISVLQKKSADINAQIATAQASLSAVNDEKSREAGKWEERIEELQEHAQELDAQFKNLQKLQPIGGYEAAYAVLQVEAEKLCVKPGKLIVERLRALPESTRERIVRSAGQYEQQIREMLTPVVVKKEHRPTMAMR